MVAQLVNKFDLICFPLRKCGSFFHQIGVLIMLKLFGFTLFCTLCFSECALAECGLHESPFSCFTGPSINPVHRDADGLYHTDYYCSDMVSSYYTPDSKGVYSGEWHNAGSSSTPDCNFYRESSKRSVQSQIENCMYWKSHNMEIPEMYHCGQILKEHATK